METPLMIDGIRRCGMPARHGGRCEMVTNGGPCHYHERKWNHRSFKGCRFWDDQIRNFRLGTSAGPAAHGRGYTIDAFGFEVELLGKGLQHMRWVWETFPAAREMMEDEPLAEWMTEAPGEPPPS